MEGLISDHYNSYPLGGKLECQLIGRTLLQDKNKKEVCNVSHGAESEATHPIFNVFYRPMKVTQLSPGLRRMIGYIESASVKLTIRSSLVVVVVEWVFFGMRENESAYHASVYLSHIFQF